MLDDRPGEATHGGRSAPAPVARLREASLRARSGERDRKTKGSVAADETIQRQEDV